MIVKTQKGSALPEGAVKLSKEEALKLQKTLINNWHSELDVFTLKYAPYLSVASTVICGAMVSDYFKKIFKVPFSYYAVSLGPTIALPSLGSLLLTDRLMTNKILLMTMDCPLCTQLKFTAFQLYNSAISPTILSFLLCHNFGTSSVALGSNNSPLLKKNLWPFLSLTIKKDINRFKMIGFIQLSFCFFLPYLQNMQLENVMKKAEQIMPSEDVSDEYFE